MYNTIVIGGGPAGFFSAIRAAECAPGNRILLLEGGPKFLSKVLISGGGRCNVTNNTPDPAELVKNYPRGMRELRGPFSRFGVPEVIEWFESRGVRLHTEPDNRMFPTSNSSQTIADCLIDEAKHVGVEIRTRCKVTDIEQLDSHANGARFEVHCGETFSYPTERLILATGSGRSGYNFARSLGHTLVPPVPSLFTFEISDPLLENLQGVSFPSAQITLRVGAGARFERSGPVLITHWGLSGPAIIQLSSLAARELFQSDYQAEISLNFTDSTAEEIFSALQDVRKNYPSRNVEKQNLFDLPKRFWSSALQCADIKDESIWQGLSNKKLRQLAELVTRKKLQIIGKGRFKEEFVTCGGVSLKEFNFQTMESKLCPGLYCTGELLDIDGITGGFNFQSAWTTGWIAGSSQL